jgi:valyl-tRNA synthetase (EC 6.1.1.9)
MHKSKGNVIDLLAPVEKYGADPVRFWAAAAGRLGTDYRYNENIIREGKEFVNQGVEHLPIRLVLPRAPDGATAIAAD